MNGIKLRVFRDDDILLLRKWLYEKHVSKWYEHPLDWIEEVEKRESNFSWIHHYIVEYNDVAIGFCQHYEYCNSGEEWHGDIEIDGTYSIDYLIGESEYLKRGFGKVIINELLNIVGSISNAKRIIVQPDSENTASCNTLLSSGFNFDESNKLYLYEYYFK